MTQSDFDLKLEDVLTEEEINQLIEETAQSLAQDLAVERIRKIKQLTNLVKSTLSEIVNDKDLFNYEFEELQIYLTKLKVDMQSNLSPCDLKNAKNAVYIYDKKDNTIIRYKTFKEFLKNTKNPTTGRPYTYGRATIPITEGTHERYKIVR